MVVIAEISEDGVQSETPGMVALFLTFPLIQCVGYSLCIGFSALTILGGIRFNQFRSKGIVFLGIASSAATPILGGITTTASSLSCGLVGFGLIGCAVGNLGTIPLLIIGVFACILGIVHITGPLGDRFDLP